MKKQLAVGVACEVDQKSHYTSITDKSNNLPTKAGTQNTWYVK